MTSCGPLAYYSPEAYRFDEVAKLFRETGTLHPQDLYLILDWKAQRARTTHLNRLAKHPSNFEGAVCEIAKDLFSAAEPKERLDVLMTKWKFLLPTASAILAVLYPEEFTVYDVRVCSELDDFRYLRNMKWSSKLWAGYERFVAKVRAAVPPELSLRDADRWLWGRNKQRTMQEELRQAGVTTRSDA